VSSIGPSAAMLDMSGQLNDMGKWYLGQSGQDGAKGEAGRLSSGLSGGGAILAMLCAFAASFIAL